jgi:hypothetical protein
MERPETSPTLPAMSAAAAPDTEPEPQGDPTSMGVTAEAAEEMAREAAAWCALHGLVVGDRSDPVSFLPSVLHAQLDLNQSFDAYQDCTFPKV